MIQLLLSIRHLLSTLRGCIPDADAAVEWPAHVQVLGGPRDASGMVDLIGYKPLSLRCRRLGACTPFFLSLWCNHTSQTVQLAMYRVMPIRIGPSKLVLHYMRVNLSWAAKVAIMAEACPLKSFWCIRQASGLRTTLGHLMTIRIIWPISFETGLPD